MAFDPLVFDHQAFAVVEKGLPLFTSDNYYWKWTKCLVEIYDNLGDNILLRYDSFIPDTNPIVLLDCEIVLGLTQTSFHLRLEDGGKVIDQNTIGLGNKVLVYGGRDSTQLTLLFTGYSETRSPYIQGDGVMEYSIDGFGEMASLNDIIANFKRASSELVDIEDPNFPIRPDAKMAVSELVKDLLTSLDVRVTKDMTVQQFLGLDISGISPMVSERLLSVIQSMTEVSQILNFLAEVTGAYWKVENGRLIFEYPDVKHSGIVIKNKVSPTDLVSTTSYFSGPWEYTDSISKEHGFANRIYTSTMIDTKSVANQMKNKGSTALYGRAIAQQFTTNESRIATIALILSRVGNPFADSEGEFSTDIEDQVVDAEIRIDSGNDKPTGAVISTFKINVGGVTSTADTIFVNDIKINAAVLSPNAKYWLVLMPVGTSLRDTIRWHHNGDLSTTGQNSAFAQGETKASLSEFKVSSRGPSYDYAIFAKIRRLQEYSDPQSIKRFRLKEDTLELDFLDDSVSVAKMMQNILAIRGKPVRRYNLREVTLPVGTWFTPGMNVTIVDDTGHHEESRNVFAEIHEVRYNWGTDSAHDKVIGLFKVSILPVGFLNWHSELFPPGD